MKRRPLTQDYFDFLIKRAKFNGKYEVLKFIHQTLGNGGSIDEAVTQLCKDVKKELNVLTILEEHYEGR